MERLVLMEMLRESYSKLMKIILEGGDFSALEDNLKRDLDELGRTMLESVVSEIDEFIFQSEERKRHWTVKRTRERVMKTVFGDVLLKRKYFQHKRTGKYAHLADVYLKIDKHQRMSEQVKHGLITRVCDVSYAKSAEVVGMTAQTTSNVLKKLKETELKQYQIPNQKRRIENIFICADEDHLAVREKGSQQQYLVYVYDGIEEIGERRVLKNIHYFTQKQKGSSEDLWLEVTEYIYDVYDVDCLKKIYIMGDGARWIKQGLGWLPKSIFVLDKWHMTKYINGACSALEYPEREDFHSMLWRSVRSGDKSQFLATVTQMGRFIQDEKQFAKVELMRLYLLNNWRGIRNQKQVQHGCSAEGHVSHILSARLSSRPMVWSAEGANKISLLRTYRANGGDIFSLNLQSDEQSSINLGNVGKIRKQLDGKIKGRYECEQVTIPIRQYGADEGVKKAIDSLFRYIF